MSEKSYPRLEDGVIIYAPEDKPQPKSEPDKAESRRPLKAKGKPRG